VWICICTEEFRFTALVFGNKKRHASGTEAVHQIAGMAKALELSYDNLEEERAQISELKKYWRIDLPLVFLNLS
jgi:cysteine sulfinate desulfinase/cysteine desulfurase-like protein